MARILQGHLLSICTAILHLCCSNRRAMFLEDNKEGGKNQYYHLPCCFFALAQTVGKEMLIQFHLSLSLSLQKAASVFFKKKNRRRKKEKEEKKRVQASCSLDESSSRWRKDSQEFTHSFQEKRSQSFNLCHQVGLIIRTPHSRVAC